MIRPKIEREFFLLSITKNCETLFKPTHTKLQETLEFKLIKPRKTFHFKPPMSIEGCGMIGFLSLEINNSIFNITEESNSKLLQTILMSFHLRNYKMSLRRSLILQILHPSI